MKPNNSTHCMTTRSTKINTQEKTSTDNISIIIILINDIILQKNIKNMDQFKLPVKFLPQIERQRCRVICHNLITNYAEFKRETIGGKCNRFRHLATCGSEYSNMRLNIYGYKNGEKDYINKHTLPYNAKVMNGCFFKELFDKPIFGPLVIIRQKNNSPYALNLSKNEYVKYYEECMETYSLESESDISTDGTDSGSDLKDFIDNT